MQTILDYWAKHWPLIILFYAGRVSATTDGVADVVVASIFMCVAFYFVTKKYRRVDRQAATE